MRLHPLSVACSSLLLIACSGDIEESVRIHDAESNARVLQILDDRGIPYRVSIDGQIFYPAEERESVRRATAEVIGSADKTRKGASVRIEDAAQIAERLKNLGIEYESFENDSTITFVWNASANGVAMSVVSEVVRAREKMVR